MVRRLRLLSALITRHYARSPPRCRRSAATSTGTRPSRPATRSRSTTSAATSRVTPSTSGKVEVDRHQARQQPTSIASARKCRSPRAASCICVLVRRHRFVVRRTRDAFDIRNSDGDRDDGTTPAWTSRSRCRPTSQRVGRLGERRRLDQRRARRRRREQRERRRPARAPPRQRGQRATP